LAQNYNTSGKTFEEGDFNFDGDVDFNDLVVLAQRYNTALTAPMLAAAFATPVVAPRPAAVKKKSVVEVVVEAVPAKPVVSNAATRAPFARSRIR